MEKKVKLAVYGSLRTGLGNYEHFLNNEDAKLLGLEILPPEYTMISLGGFPGVYKGGNSPIVVEIFEIPESLLHSIDHLEGYNPDRTSYNFYNREVINTKKFGEVYIYFISEPYRTRNHNKVEDGDWVNYVRNRKQLA